MAIKQKTLNVLKKRKKETKDLIIRSSYSELLISSLLPNDTISSYPISFNFNTILLFYILNSLVS